jgi:hypothetical protein
MSEKIYAWLLRLYPSRFRENYGEEARQLVRDRCRDEQGFLPRLRLWLDVLSDLALSLPQEYFHARRELPSYAAHLRSEGGPCFLVLEEESLGPGAWFFGGVLGLAAVISFSFLLNHGVKPVPLGALIHPARGSVDRSSFGPRPTEPARDSQLPASAPTPGGQREAATSSGPEDQTAKDAPSNAFTHPDGPHAFGQQGGQPQRATNALPARAGAEFNRAERRRVVDGAAANLKEHYIDPVVGQKMADALVEHEKNGDDDAATDGRAFADLLTRQMREVRPDRHLEVLFSEAPLPEQAPAQTAESHARYRKALERANCSFEPAKVLPHKIGYLKLNSFPDVSICQRTAESAMSSLNGAKALIFDLRENRGGEPAMVAFLAAYLFDHPEYWYNPRENTTEQSWTRSPVPGNRLADRPVYILTSARTSSGAEQFCYDLKMLRRATLVGETTAGAAHAGVWHRLDDHFGMGIPETKAMNPFSDTDWAEIGVEADVKVRAADALETAVRLAESKLQKK